MNKILLNKGGDSCNDNEEMRLKRTTVLSGNFAKKSSGCGGAPLSARDRAASETVVQQKIQRKYSLVLGGLADSVQEQEENSGDEADIAANAVAKAPNSKREQAAANDLAVNNTQTMQNNSIAGGMLN